MPLASAMKSMCKKTTLAQKYYNIMVNNVYVVCGFLCHLAPHSSVVYKFCLTLGGDGGSGPLKKTFCLLILKTHEMDLWIFLSSKMTTQTLNLVRGSSMLSQHT